ncbi:MAG: ABC transporter ATP-binding protein [Gemmatimonadetes bacterium]|nr:ABC transporter ATP-binding protein [Gemmatimonadota bacterium]
MRLVAEGITVRYAALDRPALDGLSLEVPSGSLTAVIGPNGSGKSTLMRALLGTSPLASGRVTLGDQPLDAWDRRELAKVVGAVPQSESIAFPLTARELVSMGRYSHLGPLAPESETDRAAVARALAACDVSDLADRDVATLSGGELQRARIARALASEPKALVLDEPTASLDIRHEMEILELARAKADSGITVLLITHGLDSLAQFADRMVLLAGGRIAATGTPAQVLREDVMREVYGWPIAVQVDAATGAPRVTPLRKPRP